MWLFESPADGDFKTIIYLGSQENHASKWVPGDVLESRGGLHDIDHITQVVLIGQ